MAYTHRTAVLFQQSKKYFSNLVQLQQPLSHGNIFSEECNVPSPMEHLQSRSRDRRTELLTVSYRIKKLVTASRNHQSSGLNVFQTRAQVSISNNSKPR